MKEKLKTFMKKGKWLRSTIFTIILIVLIVAIYICLNKVINQANFKDIDLTQDKLYSLSQETIDKLSSVNQSTNIVIYGMTYYPNVEYFANLYTQENSNITYEILDDVSERPDLEIEYGLGSSVTDLVIVETKDRDKAIMTSNLYTYDYTTYEEIDITEQALTNAILDVNLEYNPKIYFVTNHAKYAYYFEAAQEYISNEGNEVEELDLLVQGKVPEDCDVLVFTNLKEDITEFEKDLITEYINNGGNLMILADPNPNIELTNFQAILDLYGVNVSEGTVYESDSSKMISGYADLIIPTISGNSDITRYIASDGAVVFMGPAILTFKSDEELEELGVEKQTLITTTDTSFLSKDTSVETSGNINKDEELDGEALGAIVTKTIGEKQSKLVIYGNSIFASDLQVTLYGTSSNSGSQITAIGFYNNKDLIINSVSYLAGRKDNLTIRKDTGTISTFTATQQEENIIVGIIVALPVVILLLGLLVWQIRRRKK